MIEHGGEVGKGLISFELDNNKTHSASYHSKLYMSVAIIICTLIALVYVFLQTARFGKLPQGARLERIQKSPNYKDGKFSNLSHTPDLTEGASFYSVGKEFFFQKSKRSKPSAKVPSVKTDLKSLNPDENVVIWFGHSSYFIQVDGKKIVVDPVLSGGASPVKATTRSFDGTDIYTVDDFPLIDYLFISHDHWDHLDYETVTKLKSNVGKVICGLGVGEHLELWGYDKTIIEERDWNESFTLDSGFEVATVPARHFSGRGLKRNQSLWLSFVLKTPSMKLFLGGDSGYDSHFKSIGENHGPFDLAILECGQYDKSWKYIHMLPDEVVQASIDLKAAVLFPVHWAKFSLAIHAWDDPITKVTEFAEQKQVQIIAPLIGEKANLKEHAPLLRWWKNLQ